MKTGQDVETLEGRYNTMKNQGDSSSRKRTDKSTHGSSRISGASGVRTNRSMERLDATIRGLQGTEVAYEIRVHSDGC